MSHDYHQGPDDAVLFDGCAECDERAAKPLNALLHLDNEHFMRLYTRVRNIEFGGASDHYRSENEAAVGKALYAILVIAERHAGFHALDGLSG